MVNYNVQETQRKRFQFLQKLFDIAEGSEFVGVNLWELGDELGFTRSETDRIDDFLRGEGLIAHIVMGGTIGITHKGIIEVESALSKPDEPTTYFPPINYIHIEHMVGSQIQQGTNRSSQVLKYSGTDFEAILKLVLDLKSQLTELKLNAETQLEVESDIATIEAQVKSPRPKSTIIKECLLSLRTILEGAAGSVIAAVLLQQIAILLK